ncbi:hypothetical protein KIN20_034342 [Parelaphostrongylus tenuis]|uniref:Uncharacterized protein n=1 Tax=Parelaphostrongylus tenuis TaxID=148309 RepID=A0AAD5R9K6_PARTN|nr:hypothetical protein KIN20_034342 [Parelaphostrongylus tenuis]
MLAHHSAILINAEGPDTKKNQAEEVLNNAEDWSRKTFAENWFLSKIRENKIDMKQAQDIDSFRLPVLPNVVKCFTSSSLCLNVNSIIAEARQGDTMHLFLDELILKVFSPSFCLSLRQLFYRFVIIST